MIDCNIQIVFTAEKMSNLGTYLNRDAVLVESGNNWSLEVTFDLSDKSRV